ncbi:hypothetical protein, partial [[Ruminococcus] torques]|uniref:hypothetical protein n=1 Tax=[Ruminococcus] torques TaxID=33039 RepID=UPI003995EEA8
EPSPVFSQDCGLVSQLPNISKLPSASESIRGIRISKMPNWYYVHVRKLDMRFISLNTSLL